MKTKKYDGVGGTIVMWKLSDGSSTNVVRRAVNAIGLGEKCHPRETTDVSALRQALVDVIEPTSKKTKILVDRLRDGDGQQLVVHEVDQKQKGIDASDRFTFRHMAQPMGECDFAMDPAPDSEVLGQIKASYVHYRTTLGVAALGHCLTNVALHLGGVSLRETGGVYWMPNSSAQSWDIFGQMIELAGDNHIYNLSVMADANMVRCVGESMTASVGAEMDAMWEELELAGGELRSDAVENRTARCEELRRQVANFENAFDETLTEVREKMERVNAMLATYGVVACADVVRRSA